jgi:hypothetical protein
VGYRASWLSHKGHGTRHLESVLYGLDQEITATSPIRVLIVGVENGGSLEVWADCLPEGSEIQGIDIEPLCGELDLPVLVGDATDHGWLKQVLAGEWFHVVINTTGERLPHLWPFLVPGGVYVWEGYDTDSAVELLRAVSDETPAWLPSEEILRVSSWHGVVIVEKRSPKVVPYLEILTGEVFDVVPEEALLDLGVKRIVME